MNTPYLCKKTLGLSRLLLASLLLLSMFHTAGCSDSDGSQARLPLAHDFSGDTVSVWLQFSYDMVRDSGYSPPVASRVFGYSGVAVYEALVAGMPGNISLAGQLTDMPTMPAADPSLPYHWGEVANAAFADILRYLFPSAGLEGSPIDELESQLHTQFAKETSAEILLRSQLHGRAVAEAIQNWAVTDGFDQIVTCPFTPPQGPGYWVPTPPDYIQDPLLPCLGDMRPFALDTVGIDCQPIPPPPYSEQPGTKFYDEMIEVYQTSLTLTDEEKTIAFFWSDDAGVTGTPPGHWVAILGSVVHDKAYRLDTGAEAYARLGIAVVDAFISCWWTKYEYNLIRPISAIRDLIDAGWISIVITPPFPEYTSGHSVQSGAASQALYDFLGDVPFVDHTHDDLGFAPRAFDTWAQAAEEAAISRLYGGIHYGSAIDLGLDQGRCIGTRVTSLRFHQDA